MQHTGHFVYNIRVTCKTLNKFQIFLLGYYATYYVTFSVKNLTVPSYEQEANCGNSGL